LDGETVEWLSAVGIYLVIGAGIAWVACGHGEDHCERRYAETRYGLRIVIGWLPMGIVWLITGALGRGSSWRWWNR